MKPLSPILLSEKAFEPKRGHGAPLLFAFLFLSIGLKSQSEDFGMTSNDGEFTMKVSHENYMVKVALKFNDPAKYLYVIIEKTDDLKNEFRQCAYFELNKIEVKNGTVDIMDKYPRMQSSAYYRIRLVTLEGIERMYPPVHLPPKEN